MSLCHELREELSAYFDGELGQTETRRVESHLADCPACRKDVQDWQQQLDAGRDQWACGSCGETVTLETLNWRQCAGYSRWFVEIWHVYPHEAVPAEALIARLEELAGGRCDFFYE